MEPLSFLERGRCCCCLLLLGVLLMLLSAAAAAAAVASKCLCDGPKWRKIRGSVEREV